MLPSYLYPQSHSNLDVVKWTPDLGPGHSWKGSRSVMLNGADDKEDETKHPDPGGEGRSRHQLRNFRHREIWPIVFSKIGMSKQVASRLETPLPTPTLITARRLG